MKLNLSITLLFFLFASSNINAQLEKGDYFSNPNIGISYAFEGPNSFAQLDERVTLSRAKMVSKSVLLGLDLSLANAANRSNFTNSNVSTIEPALSIQIASQIRIYFNTKKWAPYTFLSTRFFAKKYRESKYYDTGTNEDVLFGSGYTRDNEKQFNVNLGLGFNYFFTPNFALEWNLGYDLYNKENTNFFISNEDMRLFMNTSFVFLFKKEEEKPTLPLIDRYLKPGNMLVNGQWLYRRSPKKNYNDEIAKTASLSAEVEYFIGKRTVAIANLFQYKNKLTYSGSSFLNKNLALGVGIRHYFPLKENLFLSAQAGITGSSNGENDSSNQSSRTTTVPIAINLHYFKKQTRYYFGAEYRYTYYADTSNNINRDRKNKGLDSYAGFEYFLRPSTYLRCQLTAIMATDLLAPERKDQQLFDSMKWLRLSLSYGFLIGGDRS